MEEVHAHLLSAFLTASQRDLATDMARRSTVERNESQSIVCGMGRPSRTIERVSERRAARGDARSACVGGASMRKITGKIFAPPLPRSGYLRAVCSVAQPWCCVEVWCSSPAAQVPRLRSCDGCGSPQARDAHKLRNPDLRARPPPPTRVPRLRLPRSDYAWTGPRCTPTCSLRSSASSPHALASAGLRLCVAIGISQRESRLRPCPSMRCTSFPTSLPSQDCIGSRRLERPSHPTSSRWSYRKVSLNSTTRASIASRAVVPRFVH